MPILVLLFVLSSQAHANTSVEISNNGEGSHTSVNVRSNTGGNYINGQEVNSGTGKSTTRVEVNGKVYVDETTEGNTSTNLEVHKEGNAEPTIIYNKTQPATNSGDEIKKDVKAARDEVKKEIKENEAKIDKSVKKVIERRGVKQETLLTRLENLFAKLRDIFSD